MADKIVTIKFSDEQLNLISSLKKRFGFKTNTGTIDQSLKIAEFIADGIKNGQDLAFVGSDGYAKSKIVIPALSKS